MDKASETPVRNTTPVAADRTRRSEPAPQSLSGPSFLGLSGPARGSEDVTYLFEDEQPKRTYWRFLLLLLILGIVGGLAWLQYTRAGKSWVAPWAHQQPTTPEQASQQPPSPPANPPQNPAPPAAAANAPANGQTAAQTQPGNPPAPKETDLVPGTTQAGGAAPSQPANNAAAPGQPPTEQPPANTEAANKQSEPAPAESSESKVAKKEAAEQPETTSDTTEETPAPKTKRVKPAPVTAANPDDALVANAEKYLYGRGVPQNCDRALVSLRAAADRQNFRARSLLGTMYATGHCVPRDLPNAYRWFALASRQQSDDMWIQRNLEMIWREMTPQERQLAMQTNR